MSKEEIVRALMVRRDGISVKAARMIEEMAKRIIELENKK